MRRIALALLVAVPLVGATVAAGIVSSPSKVRPCVKGYSGGLKGGPTHVDLGPDGNLWVNQGISDKIVRFDLRTERGEEFLVPKGTELHDLALGPDGNFWFSRFNGGVGRFDIDTHKIKIFPAKATGSQPHLWWAPDDHMYYGDFASGRLSRFDPETGKSTASRYNLPPDNGIHGFAELRDGSAWWTLQNSDQLAHFDLERQRFDKFVDMPKGSGPHWLYYSRHDNALWIAFQYANKLGRYDLETGRTRIFDLGLDPIAPADLQARKPLASLAFVLEDAKHEAMWLTTIAGGELIRFDLKTHEVKNVGCGLGFPAIVTTLANDREGQMWTTEASPSGGGRLGRIQP